MTSDPFTEVIPDIYVESALVPWDQAQSGDDVALLEIGFTQPRSERDVALEYRTIIRGAPGSGKSRLLTHLGTLVPKDETGVFIPLQFVRPAEGESLELLSRWLQIAVSSSEPS